MGTARAISSIIEEAEELIQVQIRLRNQFNNLGSLGAFDDFGEGLEEVNAQSRQLASSDALAKFEEQLRQVARETGVATDAVFKLGSSFVGLFASLNAGGDSIVDFATEADQIASELSVITGLSPEEAFNDLVGATRAFSEDGPALIQNLRELSNNLISVGDSSGVAANELLDFVGRIGPIAESGWILT